MAQKKLLYVVEAMGGGVFTYIVDLANELVNEFDLTIAYAVRPQTPENYREYFDPRVHLIEVKNFCREISPSKDLAALKEVKQIAEALQPDLIHLHSSKAGVIGRAAFSGRKTPLFYTPHGYSFLMKDANPLKRLVYRGIEQAFALTRCTIISCSPGEHQESLKLTRNAAYVNNAINAADLQQKLAGIAVTEHPFTVFTLGRICYQKNPALFNRIAEVMPDTHFLWIGDGELRSELTSPNIEITGWVSREEALKRSLNADMFVLTSLWEGLPISLLEAMYMKKLCAVSNVIGNRDVIRNGENGYVCDTAGDFVAAIRERNSAYADQAYRDLLEKYETKVQAKAYAEIYRQALTKQK